MSDVSNGGDVPVALKHGKNTYDDGQLTIVPGSIAIEFKQRIQSLTGVPIERQKLLCPKAWKGALKDDDIISADVGKKAKKGKGLAVTLIGTAEELVEKPVEERVKFEEDMTPEELWRARTGKDGDENDDDVVDVVDVVALQMEPGMERDDGKMERYQYNRLVNGLPQHYINDVLLKRRNGSADAKVQDEDGAVDGTADVGTADAGVVECDFSEAIRATNATKAAPLPLAGEAAMTLGMELRRAYVNSLAVLPNGTLVSGLDDGHVQLWRRGRMLKDARHAGQKVNEVIAFPATSADDPAFVTAGDGSICLWNEDGDIVARMNSYPGTTPASIVAGTVDVLGAQNVKYLAACFRVTRQVDPNRFRLAPQNEAERRRREADEMQERMIQNELARVSRCIKVWFYTGSAGAGGVREMTIPPESSDETAPVTHLLDANGKLVCGDAAGCIFSLSLVMAGAHGSTLPPARIGSMQFRGHAIACMERIDDDSLAVSIEPNNTNHPGVVVQSASPLDVTCPRCVYVIDLESSSVRCVMDAHADTVRCIRALPDGTIASAGDKMDATLRLWEPRVSSAIEALTDVEWGARVISESRVVKEAGYVFDVAMLPDSRGSGAYAIAVARYNVIKIVI